MKRLILVVLGLLQVGHAFAPLRINAKNCIGAGPSTSWQTNHRHPQRLASGKVAFAFETLPDFRSKLQIRPRTLPLHLGLDAISETITSQLSSAFRWSGPVPLPQSLLLNAVLFTLARNKLLSSLTPAGYVHAFALGTALWSVSGWRGWSVCVLYLVLGSLVTKVKFAYKEERGLAEGRGGRRGPENVWGSAATGLACAIASTQPGILAFNISPSLFITAYVASLATKLADTFASEIGKAYGKTTFLITTLERVEPGTEGAISAEGSAAAVVGGFLLSWYANLIGLIDLPSIALCTVAAFLATNVESVVGATLQEKKGMSWMTNEVVNFINTLVGAGLTIVGGKAFLGM